MAISSKTYEEAFFVKLKETVDPNMIIQLNKGLTIGDKTWKIDETTPPNKQIQIFQEVQNKLNDNSEETIEFIKNTNGFREISSKELMAMSRYTELFGNGDPVIRNIDVSKLPNTPSVNIPENKEYKITINNNSELGILNNPEDYTGVGLTSSQYLEYLTMDPSKGGYIYTNGTSMEGNSMVNGIIKSPNMKGVLSKLDIPKQQETIKMFQDAEKQKALLPITDPNGDLPTERCERITLGDTNNTTLALNPDNLTPELQKQFKDLAKTDEGKKLITSENGLKDVGGEETNSQGIETPNATDQAAGDKQPEKNDKKVIEDFNKEKYTKNSEKYKLSIGGHDDIPYFKVIGYNKLRFPNVWDNGPYHIPIMGLPPMRVQKDVSLPIPMVSTDAFDNIPIDMNSKEDTSYVNKMFTYNEDEQLKNSFLKLTIHPIDAEFFQGGVNDKTTYYKDRRDAKQKKLKNGEKNQYDYENRSVVLWDVDYKFAIEAKNDYTINHTNTYNSNGAETMLNKMNGISDIVNDINGMSQTSGGAINLQALSGLGQQLSSTGMQNIDKLIETLTAGSDGLELGSHKNAFIGFVRDVAKIGTHILTGARIDMADVWTGSNTAVRYNFEINLRTMCPNPLDIQYCKDILLPLYILYTLALPTDVARIGYKTPPYIYCNVDQFLKIKIGGIENMQVTIPSSEVNFKRAPRHVKINLTIRDLYSVMKQNSYDMNNALLTDDNGDTTDKDEFVNNFVKYAQDMGDNTVVNEPYYLTEYCKLPVYAQYLNQYIADKEKEQEAKKEQSGENTDANKGSPKQDEKNTKADTDKASGGKSEADKEYKAEKDKKGKTNILTSIGGVVTGFVKGVKDIIADAKPAIQTVRGIINTGKMILNTASNLKASFKLVGKTANLQGILNGQFASSIGFTFNNLANATDIVEGLSNGVFKGKNFGEVINNLGNLPQIIATNNLQKAINGDTMDLSSQLRDMGLSMYGVANGLGQTYAAMANFKYMGQQDTLGKLNTIFGGLSAIANGADYITKQLSWQNNQGLTRNMLTAGQVTNPKVQEQQKEVAQTTANVVQEDISDKYTLGYNPTTGQYGLVKKGQENKFSGNSLRFDFDKGSWDI